MENKHSKFADEFESRFFDKNKKSGIIKFINTYVKRGFTENDFIRSFELCVDRHPEFENMKCFQNKLTQSKFRKPSKRARAKIESLEKLKKSHSSMNPDPLNKSTSSKISDKDRKLVESFGSGKGLSWDIRKKYIDIILNEIDKNGSHINLYMLAMPWIREGGTLSQFNGMVFALKRKTKSSELYTISFKKLAEYFKKN